MKKIIALVLSLVMALSLAACGNSNAPENSESTENTPETVVVNCLNGASEEVQVEVPYDPQKIVTLDAASTDILANLGLADRIIGTTNPEAYLEEYVSGAANVGTAKTFDVEAIMELQPDVIFMAGRGSDFYDTLAEIAPVIRLTVSGAVVEGTYENSMKIAAIFGKEAEMEAKLGEYDARIAAIQALAEGKTAIVGMCTGGSFNLLGNDGRCSIIGNELGFENIGVDANVDTSTHGNEASFEFVVQAAPDYIFVLDRDKATNAEGAQLAKDIMENELVMGTDAYKNGNLIIMENAGVWYKAEGGFTALGIMLSDLESALLGNNTAAKPETVVVNCLNGASEEVQVEIPYDPQKIVTLDAASTDILANLGLADRIIGTTNPEAYLEEYVSGAANVGTAKTFDVEAIMELQPDVIFMAGRGSDFYDTLSEIAPVIRLTVSGAVVEGTYENSMKIAAIFGKEAEMEAKLGEYDARIAAIQALAEGKTAIVGMCTGGSFNLLGNDGRCSIIGNELGFENIGVDANVDTSTHGNEASFEFVVQAAPDYIFVLDRDKATNAEGAQLAKDIMENELVMGTDAYKNGNLIIMENAGVWYKAEGGFTALGIMLSDLEAALLN